MTWLIYSYFHQQCIATNELVMNFQKKRQLLLSRIGPSLPCFFLCYNQQPVSSSMRFFFVFAFSFQRQNLKRQIIKERCNNFEYEKNVKFLILISKISHIVLSHLMMNFNLSLAYITHPSENEQQEKFLYLFCKLNIRSRLICILVSWIHNECAMLHQQLRKFTQ